MQPQLALVLMGLPLLLLLNNRNTLRSCGAGLRHICDTHVRHVNVHCPSTARTSAAVVVSAEYICVTKSSPVRRCRGSSCVIASASDAAAVAVAAADVDAPVLPGSGVWRCTSKHMTGQGSSGTGMHTVANTTWQYGAQAAATPCYQPVADQLFSTTVVVCSTTLLLHADVL